VKQLREAYIVAATRTPIGKAPRGMLRTTRPDDMLAHVIKRRGGQVPGFDAAEINDVVAGCAFPEAEQGLNLARIGLLLAGLPNTVAGITINRYCSSGINAVQIAADRIRTGEADVDDRRRQREHVDDADDGQQSVAEPGDLRQRREPRHRLRHGLHRRKGGPAMADQPRRPRRLCGRKPNRRAVAAIAAGKFKAEISPIEAVYRSAEWRPRSARSPQAVRHRRRPARRYFAGRPWPSCARCLPPKAR
jgi:acetyl-CoA acyltransferase